MNNKKGTKITNRIFRRAKKLDGYNDKKGQQKCIQLEK